MSTSEGNGKGQAVIFQTGPATPEGVDVLYQKYLGRTADAEAQDAIKARAMSLKDVEEMIFSSPEFFKRATPTMHPQRGDYDGAIIALWPAKVLFCPIAKVANTAIKDWALRLVGDGQPEPGDSHYWLDSGQNKMQVRHMPLAGFDQLSRDKDWASVAVIRNPIDRLVSSYCDKFGRNRHFPSVLQHTLPVYTFLNGGEKPSAAFIDEGISFRQFCFFLSCAQQETLDPHWTPQWNYLRNHSWDRLFSLDKIEEFEVFILDRLPANLRDERLEVSNAAPIVEQTVESDLSMSLPVEWGRNSVRNPPYDTFLTDDICRFIKDYYALDFQLYALAQTSG